MTELEEHWFDDLDGEAPDDELRALADLGFLDDPVALDEPDEPMRLTWVTPDGQIEIVPAVNTRGESIPDMAELDNDADGRTDAWLYDPAGTGQADVMLVDLDRDGKPDELRLDVDGQGTWLRLDEGSGTAAAPFDASVQLTSAAEAAERQGDSALADRLRAASEFFLADSVTQPWLRP